MRQRAIWLSSGVGATLAFLFDPTSGHRRRRRLRDAAEHLVRQAVGSASTVARDLRNRSIGVLAAARHLVRSEHPDDVVLEERVHSALGRVIAHPHLITVQGRNGHVVLDGPIPASEASRVVHAVRAVRGVRRVETRFTRHIEPAHEPAVEPAVTVTGPPPRLDILQRRWAPATRAIAAGAGATLLGAALARRDRARLGLGAAGAALVARAATNQPLARLLGLGAGRPAIDVRKTITVDVPVDRIYAFWENPSNLPAILRHVRDVKAADGLGRWRWTMSGALGAPIEFVTELTDRVPNRQLAWKTAAGSRVEHTGVIRFEPIAAHRTRLDVRLSYRPPGGAITHSILALLGADPKRWLEEDLARMKTALEAGRPVHDAARAS